jgi:hypothetical protein
MQDDLSQRFPDFEFQILAVNERGHSTGIETAVKERTLPLLQDDMTQMVWENWAVTYRDVIVLDGENKVFGLLNLTDNSLAEAEHYATVEGLLLQAGGLSAEEQSEDTATAR